MPNVFDINDSASGCLQQKSRNSQWGRADRKTLASGCRKLLRNMPFTASLPSAQPGRWSSSGFVFVRDLVSAESSLQTGGVWSRLPDDSSSACVWRIILLKLGWNCPHICSLHHTHDKYGSVLISFTHVINSNSCKKCHFWGHPSLWHISAESIFSGPCCSISPRAAPGGTDKLPRLNTERLPSARRRETHPPPPLLCLSGHITRVSEGSPAKRRREIESDRESQTERDREEDVERGGKWW